jgi:hypothetical protein
MILHWDGSAWNTIPSPNPGPDGNYLYGVAAVAADNVWAVGTARTGAAYQTLILHWDGTVWSVVPSPSPGSGDILYAVAARNATDVWAVGRYDNGGGPHTLTLHWVGQGWSVVPSPNPATLNNLYGVAVRAADDAWAGGSYYTADGLRTIILHWDGSQWSTSASPNPGLGNSELVAVTALAADNAWAVGSSTYPDQTFICHWNGSAWQVVPSPNPGFYNHLRAVTAITASDIWAVGDVYTSGPFQTLVAHWTGSQWLQVPSPNPGAVSNMLLGVSAVSTNDVWAVGYVESSGGARQTLVEHYSGLCGSPTPTPTVCPIQFTDVDQNNPFYPFIRCLACRQIVSGYSDGTFRWGNSVTRGQLAKIIANAAGLTVSIPPTQQTFEDVPSSNAFWLFVERLYATNNVITGYHCGGPGEPCVPPANRPYYRWGANATRGQIAKIAALAAQIADPIPSTRQTFEDVPPSNAFWVFIEQLYAINVISGYTCGGAGEPCLPPGNRPYFRWGANATRGQISKIAAQTFYPNCQTPARP